MTNSQFPILNSQFRPQAARPYSTRMIESLVPLSTEEVTIITLPVVLMTSFGCDRTRADGAAAGAAGLLSKPFSIRELRDAVGAALAKPAAR